MITGKEAGALPGKGMGGFCGKAGSSEKGPLCQNEKGFALKVPPPCRRGGLCQRVQGMRYTRWRRRYHTADAAGNLQKAATVSSLHHP